MPEKEDFRRLLAEVVAGSREGSARFLERFGPDLLHAVRRRLPRRLRTQFDSLDFVQDVWASFFVADKKHDFAEPEDVVALLTRIAQHKVVDVIRERMAQKRNINREQPLPEGSTAAAAIPQLIDRHTPSMAAMDQETWQTLLRSQPPVYRRVLLLLREGNSITEVGEQMDISEKTVRRIVDRVSTRLALIDNDW